MNVIQKLLSGNDLRTLGDKDKLRGLITSQNKFDELMNAIFSGDRVRAMRAADAAEKITRNKPDYLKKYKRKFMGLLDSAENKELKWHIAAILPRFLLTGREALMIWDRLMEWASDVKESKIVRVNSLDGMYELLKYFPEMKREYILFIDKLDKEGIPSVTARIKKIRKMLMVKNINFMN